MLKQFEEPQIFGNIWQYLGNEISGSLFFVRTFENWESQTKKLK